MGFIPFPTGSTYASAARAPASVRLQAVVVAPPSSAEPPVSASFYSRIFENSLVILAVFSKNSFPAPTKTQMENKATPAMLI